jgi:hypothetical protein
MNKNVHEVVHKVETQWHYPIMIKHGFQPKTLEVKGLVRSYEYEHPETKHRMIVATGVHCDYWSDLTAKAGGYWDTLESHIKHIEKQG